ncbi:hypothetical protein TI04_00550 [Achromatium sp. WMS2]|nr:hypothetical protein TI04_00550 [Achromatium sp. WMS2]
MIIHKLTVKFAVLTLAICLFVNLNYAQATEPTNVALQPALELAKDLTTQREPVLTQARILAQSGKLNVAMDTLEAYLNQQPGDIIAGNFYRKLAVQAHLYERSIKFFLGHVRRLTPCPQQLPVCPDTDKDCVKKILARCSATAVPPGPPAGLLYNLAFAYIDKIPVVGPMGAGFLSKRSIEQFKTALQANPDDWIANYGIGMNYLHWPDYFEKNDTSITYFEKAIALQQVRAAKPADILAYIRLGDAWAKAGNVDNARQVWQQGVTKLGKHQDLMERLDIPKSKLKVAVTEAYNPNNSIGAIDTDISILWADVMPTSVFSLHNTSKVSTANIGGQSAPQPQAEDNANLFQWFRNNLPLLVRRESADKIDMSGIGATNNHHTGIIAHNMIRGFMSQFRGDSNDTVLSALNQAPNYEQPFFHEGIGMGVAATLDTSADGSLAPFATDIAVFGNKFERLHYAGLGMWYGLAPTLNLVRIRNKFADLDLRGQFYAYEGLGFAVTLFGNSITRGAANVVRRLPFALASTFAHGAGRALWIKYGANTAAINQAIAAFPEQLHSDLYSGFGMGVTFTRINQLDELLNNLQPICGMAAGAKLDYLTGAAMGLAIRYQTDTNYTRSMLRNNLKSQTRALAVALLAIGNEALTEVQQTGVEMHKNWRAVIKQRVVADASTKTFDNLCENKK